MRGCRLARSVAGFFIGKRGLPTSKSKCDPFEGQVLAALQLLLPDAHLDRYATF